jgi:NADH-quinone oxidoreductase subunit J
VITFINVAAIYLLLRAEFLAAVQIIVYTGAILVLVLFVIMLVNQDDLPEFHGGHPVQRVMGFALGLILLGEVAAAILTREIRGEMGVWTPDAVAAVGGNVQAIGQVLYSTNVLPIQATALVLLVATIGALVLARPDEQVETQQTPRQVFTISLSHARGSDGQPATETPALAAANLKPEAGERSLVMARTGDEHVDQPVWKGGETHE